MYKGVRIQNPKYNRQTIPRLLVIIGRHARYFQKMYCGIMEGVV